MSADNGIIISNVSFGENGVEIIYLETREQAKKVGIVRTVIYEYDSDTQDRIDDIVDSIEEILDEALIQLRNPSRKRSIQERARDIGRGRYDEYDENDDDDDDDEE